MILAIDPGSEFSAYVVLEDGYKIVAFGKESNDEILATVTNYYHDKLIIEMISSYGMPVGKEVFDTCVWIGRFIQASQCPVNLIYRKEVKLHLCNSVKAKDSNIIQALKDRFGDKGTKKNPGPLYGIKSDIWQALAVGITHLDRGKNECNTGN